MFCYENGKSIIMAAYYKSGNNKNKSNNNKDKIYLLLIRWVGASYNRLHARSHNHKFCNYSITIAFFFSVSSNKKVIVKSYLQLDKKPPNLIEKQEEN